MELKKITDNLSVSPQITADDMAAIKAAGFHTIVCNRPDGESADQPNFEEIKNAANALGIEARYVPITPGQVKRTDVDAFATAIDTKETPTLAYCRTGTRSSTLWSLHQSADKPDGAKKS